MSLLRRMEDPRGSTRADPKPAVTFDPPPRINAPSRDSGRDLSQVSQDLRARVQSKLIAEMDPKMDLSDTDKVRRTIEELFNAILDQENVVLVRADRQRLFEQIAADILGFGPIEPLLADETISEIMVNGPRLVFIERKGRIEKTDVVFQDDQH